MRILGLACAVVLAAAGCKEKTSPEATNAPDGAVKIAVGDDGFKPSAVKLAKGSSGTLVFLRTSDDTCATDVVFPELNIKKPLPKGQAVTVSVPTDKEQTLTFQCGMGMYKSSVVVAAK